MSRDKEVRKVVSVTISLVKISIGALLNYWVF